MFLNKLLRFMNIVKTRTRFNEHQIALALQKGSQKSKFNKLFYITPTIMGLWTYNSTKEDKKSNESAMKEALIIKADALYDQGLYKQLYDLLSNYKDSKDVEILWRLSRVLYNMSKTAEESEARIMILEAYDLIETALSIKEDHYAIHKWISILLDSKSAMEGTKSRIQQLYNVKKHMLRAIELNPRDATTMHMLGSWCYQVSDLAWYQRKVASLVFGEPPNSSFEEALMYFEQAEKTNPNFYSHNLLMLAKTYLKLGKREDALRYLKLTADYPTTNHEDVRAKKEAQEMLYTF